MRQLEYSEYRATAQDFDVVAFEGRGAVSRAIRTVTGGTVTHVGLALWSREDDVLELAESRELRGGRRVLLSREIAAAGHVLVYRAPGLVHASPELRRAARRWLVRAMGSPYDYRGLLAFIGLGAAVEDRLSYGHRFCSALVSAVYLRLGLDLVPERADSATSPAAIAAAPALELLGRVEVLDAA